IAAAGGDDGVAVLAVTKGFGPDAIESALAAGCTAIGENYAQELIAKRDAASRAEVHFIGQLQTNKVRQVAGLVDVYETVDRARLAHEIARRVPGARVLVQVDTSRDTPRNSGKGGCPLAEVDALVAVVREARLDLLGLMTVGPTEGGAEAARPGFRETRAAVDRLGLSVCSMGMTDDLEVAVQEGSTQIRVGTALFGKRG
ncbi:MAG TPA: YggS family pyridoxal phosphate-dependent enzyme, partial [Ilumatobacteraceae bacterium]|nr:YggS family pyridoxal phosphate-dependent enzyme [Ilumatobacteraceae bacterium]